MDESTLRVCVGCGGGGGRRSMAILLLYILLYTHAVQLFLACPFPYSLPFSFHWNGADSQGEKSRPDKGDACDDETDVLSFSSILFFWLLVAPGGPFFFNSYQRNANTVDICSISTSYEFLFFFQKFTR